MILTASWIYLLDDDAFWIYLLDDDASWIYLLDDDLDCILDILEEEDHFEGEVEEITTNASIVYINNDKLITNKYKCM